QETSQVDVGVHAHGLPRLWDDLVEGMGCSVVEKPPRRSLKAFSASCSSSSLRTLGALASFDPDLHGCSSPEKFTRFSSPFVRMGKHGVSRRPIKSCIVATRNQGFGLEVNPSL